MDQTVTRPEIEETAGVSCADVVALLESRDCVSTFDMVGIDALPHTSTTAPRAAQ